MSLVAAGAILFAFALDRLVGEFPSRIHPVALFGRLVAPFDREWTRPRTVGFAVALLLPLVAAVVAGSAVALAGRLGGALAAALGQPAPLARAVVLALAAGVVLFTTTSLRMLLEEALAVVAASETDVEAARSRLPALAGRDATDLSAGQLRSAAVESAAENLSDGLVAPLLAFVLLSVVSLPLAAAGAAWVKAVNTLDSMLGYPENSHGTASARLDDLVMWIPARASAVLLALAARDPDALRGARRWARVPPSPNAGWPMATVAAALHVRLEKPGVYTLNEVGGLPTVADAERGVRITRLAGLLAVLGAAGVVAWS